MPPPPQLMDELVEEILLRIPPDSPASLVRAGLVCKRWCHLVSDPNFQRRFREHHRSPPILGFLDTSIGTSFVSEPAFALRPVYHPGLFPRECRHGRVLLYSKHLFSNHSFDEAFIVVWDPITGERVQLQLPNPPLPFLFVTVRNAAVLCAAAPSGTCDHLDCHGGPFIVVLVVHVLDGDLPISSYVYSSESGAWSEPTFSPHSGGSIGRLHSSLLVRNALYFVPQLLTSRISILQYDLGTREITAINPPKAAHMERTKASVEFIATKDGRLGFASVEKTKLSLWSREVVGGGRWALCQVIDLEKLIPLDAPRASTPYLLLVGSTEDSGVIFLRVQGCRIVSFDLWSGLVTEVYDRKPRSSYIRLVVPYRAFFTPDDGPRESASSS